MTIFKRIFNFYIQSSLHVALAGAALVVMTLHMFNLQPDWPIVGFVFSGIVVGYNFVKYDALARMHKLQTGNRIKTIAALSFLFFLLAGWCFLKLNWRVQLTSILFLGLTLLYTLPFFPNRRNARNWAGVKIYIVALCWVGVTLVLPVLNADITITSDFYLKCIQRFIFIFVLVLIFEIIDVATDDPHLQTVPQKIGIPATKKLGVLLLILFFFLEFLKRDVETLQLMVNAAIVILMSGMLIFANPDRQKYYSLFWAELLPVVWLALLLIGENLL